MKLNVMIVDDEAHIRNGMKMKVDWEQLGMSVMAEASDGLEALNYIENGNIDLVITDINMPLMDGLTFIQKALEISKDVKFIIVSGYSEFEYARTAMKFGITEYLLKPLKETDMQTSLMKIKDEILTIESVWLKEHAKREESKRREESLLHLLTGKHTQSAAADFDQELQLELDTENILIGVMKTELHEASTDSSGRVRNYTLYYDIESAFNSFLAKSGSGHIIKSIRPEHEYILLLPNSQSGKEKMIRLLTSFIGELLPQLGVRITIGLGGTPDKTHTIKRSYNEALFAVKERIMCGSGRVIDYTKIPIKSDKPNFNAETKLLVRLLEERKWNNVKEHIQFMFSHSLQKGILSNHTHVYELFIEIYFVIKQFAKGDLAGLQESPVMGSGEVITEIVGSFSHTDQMVDWLYQYTESACYHFKEGQDATGKEIVYRVQKYIREFYSSDLTLNLVSEKYHINPIYFSRIFKTHIGESFNSYITRIRMEEAKNLMETTSLKMHDISEIVGYEDPKYFSKVFKKHFGVSPSLYTENRHPKKTGK
jgi:two-component system response regulator YesN